MSGDEIKSIKPLGFPWVTLDPFLFCVHHDDAYPKGNAQMGPAASLAGRNIGQDFEGIDGWRMYHGDKIPGFPRHPHRGFETITLARNGYIDHSDSMGATARFGHGDVQWMTAGKGIVHSEMFPLVHEDKDNPVELFQLWINLPREDKFVEPHFSMFWNHTIPHYEAKDAKGRATNIRVIAGSLGNAVAPTPPPKSWAARPNAKVAIWTIKMEPNAEWELPRDEPGLNRMLYFFRGQEIQVAGQAIPHYMGVELRADAHVVIQNGPHESELLLLQGRPIAEPVVHYGPFVMNTVPEIKQAISDYQRTLFGGWPWPDSGPVHARSDKRFAKHADGKVENAG